MGTFPPAVKRQLKFDNLQSIILEIEAIFDQRRTESKGFPLDILNYSKTENKQTNRSL